jgi:hypothetical protein
MRTRRRETCTTYSEGRLHQNSTSTSKRRFWLTRDTLARGVLDPSLSLVLTQADERCYAGRNRLLCSPSIAGPAATARTQNQLFFFSRSGLVSRMETKTRSEKTPVFCLFQANCNSNDPIVGRSFVHVPDLPAAA